MGVLGQRLVEINGAQDIFLGHEPASMWKGCQTLNLDSQTCAKILRGVLVERVGFRLHGSVSASPTREAKTTPLLTSVDKGSVALVSACCCQLEVLQSRLKVAKVATGFLATFATFS